MRILYSFALVLILTAGLLASAPENVAGTWQISWQVRLGTAHATVQLKQDGSKLSGTFEEMGVSSRLSGSIQGKEISLDVDFPGPRPYTIEFVGTVDGEKISGKSRAKNVEGAGAYLGHGGEVVQPDHPWTASRTPERQDQPSAKNR
jgi:hypothetical protein